MTKKTNNEWYRLLVLLVFFIFASVVVIMVVIIYVTTPGLIEIGEQPMPILVIYSHSVPDQQSSPPNSSMHNMTHNVNTTNYQIMPAPTQGVGVLSYIVGFVALIISFVGIFLTLEIIGVGNFRQNFINTLTACKEQGLLDETVSTRDHLWSAKYDITLSELAKKRTEKIYKNTKVLTCLNMDAIIASIFVLLILMTVISLYIAHVANLLTIISKILFYYIFFLIVLLSLISYFTVLVIRVHPEFAELQQSLAKHIIEDTIPTEAEENTPKNTDSNVYKVCIYKTVSYPDLAELCKALAKHIMEKDIMTNDQEEAQQENADRNEGG